MSSKLLLAALLLWPASVHADIPPPPEEQRRLDLLERKACGPGETKQECYDAAMFGSPPCSGYQKDPAYYLLGHGRRKSYYCRKAENWSKLSAGQRLSRVRDFLRDLRAAEASAADNKGDALAAQNLVARFPPVEREVAALEKKAKKSASEAAVLKDAVSSLKLRGRVAALGGGDVEPAR